MLAVLISLPFVWKFFSKLGGELVKFFMGK